LSYVLRHKWFVFVAGYRLGVPWRAFIHDNSKFLPSEWFPYAEYFYGDGRGDTRQTKSKTGYYKPAETRDARFDFAWLLHQRRNPHHWQWWILREDEGKTKIFEMSHTYRREMLADWIGAGRAQGKPDIQTWYLANRRKMVLGPETRGWIENALCVVVSMEDEDRMARGET